MTKNKSIFIISIFILVLMIIQSSVGYFYNIIYRDNIMILSSLKGNDLVTLLVASPVFLISIIYYYRDSIRAKYFIFALLFYSFYNYAYYVFGSKINYLFPLHIMLFTLSGITLILQISSMNKNIIISEFHKIKTIKIMSVFLMLFSVLITYIWISKWFIFVTTGVIPELFGMEESYRLVATMDLSVQIPCLAIASVLLWKNNPTGYFIATTIMIANSIYMMVLMAYSPFASNAGIQDAWSAFPLWLILFSGCFISSFVLIRNIIEK